MSNLSFQNKVERELEREHPQSASYLEILWRPWRLIALRWWRYGFLSVFRSGVHFLRYFLLLSLLPEFDLTSLAGWMLKIGLIEAALYGAVEEIREASREGKPSEGSALRATRKWNRRMIVASGLILSLHLFQSAVPIWFRGRVFSLYDLIQGVTVIRLMWSLVWMPEVAFVQGKTRMHMDPLSLYLPEVLSVLGLPVLIFFLGPWGLAWHFAWEFLIKEGNRMRVFLTTRRNLGLGHKLLRWPKQADRGFPPTRVHLAWIGNQILGRAESVLLPVLWKLDIARGLVFYVPLIRSLVDFGKVFQFDVLRKRFFLDRVLSSLVVRRASVLGVVYFGIVLLLFWGSSRMVFDSAVDAEEVWVFLGALFFGVFNFNLVHRLWRSVRKKKKGSGTWIRCRFIRCPESTEFKAFLDHHRELYGLFSVSSLGRNGLLLNCRDAKVSREKIERRAPGLVISWETLGAPEAHSPERAQEWKQFKAKLDEVAIPRSEAREVLDREARSVRQMLEQGDNGRKSSDRQWRLFYDPAILRGSSIWIVPNSLWKVTPDRIRLGELARTTAYEFRLKGAFNGE